LNLYKENVFENLIIYQKLIDINGLGKEEMGLVKAWV